MIGGSQNNSTANHSPFGGGRARLLRGQGVLFCELDGSASDPLAHYGIDAGAYSFPYVANWAKDKAVLRRNLAEVQGVAAALIAGIEEARLMD